MVIMDERYLEDLNWAGEHHSKLLQRYREQWVAVHNRRVVAFGKSIIAVRKNAQSKTGEEHIPVYFVDSPGNIYAS